MNNSNELKLLLLVVTFIFPAIVFSQSIEFKTSKASHHLANELSQEFHKVDLYKLEGEDLSQKVNKSNFDYQLKLNFGNKHKWNFQLQPFEVFTENAVIRELSSNGEILHPIPQNIAFRGYDENDPETIVTMIIHDKHVFAIVTNGEQRTYITSANKYIDAAADDLLLVFDQADQKSNEEGACGHDQYPEFTIASQDSNNNLGGQGFSQVGNCYDVALAVASDFQMYQDQGSTIQGTINHVLDVMADVNTNYVLNGSTNFDDGIVYVMVEQVVSTCSDCDPWTASTDSGILLDDFRDWALNGGFLNDHDMGSLWSDRNFEGATVGLAYTGSNLLCGNTAYHVLQDYTNNANNLRVMTAHEMGHNWGSGHTAGCIMNSSVNEATCWHINSQTVISAQIASQGPACLTLNCPGNPCDSLEDVVISNITSTGFDIAWTATTESAYRLRVRDESDFSIIHTTNPTSSTTMTINPVGWEDCKIYSVIVENDCGGTYGPITSAIVESFNPGACADFEADKLVGWLGAATIQFTDQSTGVTSWTWDFGDGNSSTAQNPSHTYNTIGIYTVSLTINGGISTKTRTDYIQILPDEALPYETTDGGDMEGNDFGADSQTAGRTTLWEKGVPSNYFNNATNCWVTDLDADVPSQNNESWLYGPRFDFSNVVTATLNLDLGMEAFFSNAPYGLQVHYSLDNGSTWTRLGTDADANWYNRGPSSAWALSTAVFADQRGFLYTNPSFSWSYDVTALAGNSSVIFGFVFSAAGGFSSGGYLAGAMLDNISVDATFPLPVELSSFNGEKEDKGVRLKWSTESEVNNDYFLIEKSTDGRNFEALGTVQGKGTTYNTESYDWLDDRPSIGVNYYRLTQFDFDGTFEIFNKIVAVTFYGDQEIQVSPNPVKGDQIQLIYQTNTPGELELDIYNTAGQLVQQLNVQTTASRNVFDISLNEISNGVYIIRATQGDTIQSLRFVKTQ